MKRLVSIFLALIITFTFPGAFTGCSKSECDFCGENTKVKTVDFFGEKIKLCNDCNSFN